MLQQCWGCYDFQEVESVPLPERVTNHTKRLPRRPSGEDYMLGLEMTSSH